MSGLEKKDSKSRLDPSPSNTKKQRTIREILALSDEDDDVEEFTPKLPPTINSQTVKTPNDRIPWGCIQFYENSKLVLSQDLWSEEPIKVTGDTLRSLNETSQATENPNYLINYTDWTHVLGEGFVLKRKYGMMSKIEMQKLDMSLTATNYKVFTSDRVINVVTNYPYEIYNFDEMIKNLDLIKSISGAYEFKKHCCSIIGLHGEFMKAMGPIFGFESITRQRVTSLPYWILLKLNPEYTFLDRKTKSILK